VSRLRHRGYTSALRAAGLSPDDRFVAHGDFTEEQGYDAAESFMQLDQPPTAIFAANDMMAIGALSALRRRRNRAGSRVAVAGFDGLALSKYVAPGLTTYQQPVREMASRSISLLLKAVEENSTESLYGPQGQQIVRTLPGQLIVRKSTSSRP
jgi:DNA-binding LacI/PurR family transcriptional regulator